MFKDYNKYLKTSLKVYIFVLLIIFIMKLIGLDYFGLDISNPKLIKISNYLSSNHFGDIYYFITLYLQLYFYLCLVCEKRNLHLYTLIGTILNFSFQIAMPVLKGVEWIYFIICFGVTIIFPMIINRKVCIKRQVIFLLLMNFYQLICLGIRSIGINQNYNNFIIDSLLNIDQLLLMAITYNIYFMKGGLNLCGEIQEVGSSLLKKNHYSNLLKNLQENYSNFKKYNKQDKATIIIYSIFSLIWNIFTLVVVLFMAKLNDTFIECIFIISSFWLSKKVFGKAFHLKSMIGCFILSNATYYVLNRITTPVGISILVPIMLGVGLSYITSKFVRNIKPLYKGMSEEEFENTILKVVDKDSDKYKICYDFFIKKENAISLGYKYNYTEAGYKKNSI